MKILRKIKAWIYKTIFGYEYFLGVDWGRNDGDFTAIITFKKNRKGQIEIVKEEFKQNDK